MGARHRCSSSPGPQHPSCTPVLSRRRPLSPGSPLSHRLLTSILQARRGQDRSPAQLPHQLPQQPGPGPVCPSAALRSAPGPQECGHKGPLCERAGGRGAVAQPSSRAGAGESPLPTLLAAPAPAAGCREHPAALPARAPAQSWHLLGARAKGRHGLSRRRGSGAGAESTGQQLLDLGFFNSCRLGASKWGMRAGWGCPGPRHGALDQLFIALASLPSRNGLCSGDRRSGATGVPTTNSLSSGPCQEGEVSSRKGLSAASRLPPPPFLLAPSTAARVRFAAHLAHRGKRCPRAVPCFTASLLNPPEP